MNETVRSKITENMLQREREWGIFPMRRQSELFELIYTIHNGDVMM